MDDEDEEEFIKDDDLGDGDMPQGTGRKKPAAGPETMPPLDENHHASVGRIVAALLEHIHLVRRGSKEMHQARSHLVKAVAQLDHTIDHSTLRLLAGRVLAATAPPGRSTGLRVALGQL
jgi:hypothetical protein